MASTQPDIDATFIIVLGIGLLGTALFVLGLMASFDDYRSLHPLLADPLVRVTMMGFGGLAMVFEARFIIGWARARSRGR